MSSDHSTQSARTCYSHEVVGDPFPGEFRLMERLGGGAFGAVYKALDLSPLGRLVALKFLSPRSPEGRAHAALENEARLVASARHPNIVQALAWKTTPCGMPCLVMEFIPGGSLQSVLVNQGPLPWQQAGRYIADVAAGLVVLHKKGIVHRDVKPDNLLLDDARDEALLTDLGVGARLSAPGDIAGTLPYMPPEAFDGHVSAAQDVYGLAATLFCLLTGSPPFRGAGPLEYVAASRNGLPTPDPRLHRVPAAIEQLLRDGLSPGLATRPSLEGFAGRLRGALNALLADQLSTAPSGLRILVSRLERGAYVPVATSLPTVPSFVRDMARVPPLPGRVSLRTGDRLRIEVETDEPGHVVVFNVGPTGNLNLLHPQALEKPASLVHPDRPLHVGDVRMMPPAGAERLFALWTRSPLPLVLGDLEALAGGGGLEGEGYRATRDMVRVQQSLAGVPQNARRTVVLELEHVWPRGEARRERSTRCLPGEGDRRGPRR